ncbi:DUF2493 domain-containing protein [Nodosilinea sp. LEGE 07298]|uniref:DUF2493 domain-containing protein n=1 Tax=Nodosilinea sp. LEGE 07298 TaxID=2777970 RepID=UPI00188262DE|nr:DUF2493 domain-containing protein [Nodosilinea sp. LEGE 07298]MBE9109316.1 DUF2493 domain-containing protein [Nodosilinea sp. LEGE 07298]
MTQGQSATAIYTAYAELYGIREDITALPLPDKELASNGITEMLELMFSLLVDSSLEPDTGDLLWQLVQVLHRQAQRCERESDSNADKQRELQDAQDGSEVKAVSLEEALTMGHFLQERQAFYEGLRDHAADVYEGLTGKAWLPRSGSKGSRSPISAAVVDSRAFLHAQQQAKQQANLPAGVRVVVSGGKQATHQQIWAILDKVKAKHGEIVLLHGGGDGVEHLAALWAKNRQVAQVMFRPDWNKHGRAAPFKRNDAMLRQAPQGVIVIAPDSGIHQQLIREATQQGLRLMVVEA